MIMLPTIPAGWTPAPVRRGTELAVRLATAAACDNRAGQPEVYDPRNHSLVAVWNQQPFSPRHAMHPSGFRTVCGVDTRSGSWETWQPDWHGFVDGGDTACRRCVRMTRP